jgi:glucokinase-like ROK family protein
MMSNLSTTSSLLRSINRSAILDMIRHQAPISRTQIANDLGLSLPTVMRVVDELIAENLVQPHGKNESTRGRPRSLLNFNPAAYAVIGVDLGSTQMLGAITDLSGNIQHEITIRRTSDSPEDNFEQLCGVIEKLLAESRPPSQQLRGFGIGVPGVTAINEGIVEWAPSLGWRDFPLRERLQARFAVPIFVENDVNLAALGELAFGAGRGTQNMVCVNIGTGIGAGIIMGGGLYRGHNQAAGEIGYLLPSVKFLGQRYDEFGPLEYYAAGLGIARRAKQLLDEAGIANPSDPNAEEVFEAAREGKAWAQQVVQETVDYISLAVAAVSALIDPDMIVLGGAISFSADLLIEPILERLQGVIPYLPRFVASPLGHYAAVKGASLLVLNGTMDSVRVKQFP